ncbi:Fic family protein [Mycolicibacterium sp. CR10]|uniref:type II toxin-antitoxin system ParD family antitoxin n=1 Tax=Mycolicibacterium sp. CR10 TaxID=2562314 RepID=UPI00351796B4
MFDGLSVSRRDTENFLRSGSLEGVASRADLALLEDLRDAAQFVIDHAVGGSLDAGFVRAVNATLTRSGALHPGQLRTQEQAIGVSTAYGRHTPAALTEDALQTLLDSATRSTLVQENALDLFVDLATAQPFEDGNKRTAVFVANSLLVGSGAGVLLTIPVDDNDPSVARTFNDLLARAYVYGEHDGVKTLLRSRLRETRLDAVRQALIAGERSGEATPFDFDDFGSGYGIIEVWQGRSGTDRN